MNHSISEIKDRFQAIFANLDMGDGLDQLVAYEDSPLLKSNPNRDSTLHGHEQSPRQLYHLVENDSRVPSGWKVEPLWQYAPLLMVSRPIAYHTIHILKLVRDFEAAITDRDRQRSDALWDRIQDALACYENDPDIGHRASEETDPGIIRVRKACEYLISTNGVRATKRAAIWKVIQELVGTSDFPLNPDGSLNKPTAGLRLRAVAARLERKNGLDDRSYKRAVAQLQEQLQADN